MIKLFIVPLSPLPSIFPEAPNLQEQQNSLVTNIPFANVLSDAIKNMEQVQSISQQDSYNLALGKTDDLHTIQINSLKASTAINFTTALTGKVLSTYNEIMRMSI